MKEELNIENLYRENFGNYALDPTPSVWKKLQRKLWFRRVLQFSAASLNAFTLVFVALVSTAVVFFVYAHPNQETQKGMALQPKNTQHKQFNSSLYAHINTPPQITPVHTHNPKSKSGFFENPTNENTNLPDNSTTPRRIDPGTIPDSLKDKPVSDKNTDTQKQPLQQHKHNQNPTESSQNSPAAHCIASVKEGCAPLAVQFFNRSENAVVYEWHFGDGAVSSEVNPQYVYQKPGTYVVVLKASCGKGDISYDIDTIVVHENPNVKNMQAKQDMDALRNYPVEFSSIAQRADSVQWDFGDNQSSQAFSPVHVYQRTGNYRVKLRAWSENLCYDSLIYALKIVEPKGKIIFPNAFTPNPNGPSNGYYSQAEMSNDVFFPVATGIVEYHLKIYNRWGVKLFESRDINRGWDGYYNERMLDEGVYIWEAKGKFEDGRTFKKAGNVTLILNN